MKRLSILVVLLLCLPVLAPAERVPAEKTYLVKVDLPSEDRLYRLGDLGVPILEDMGEYVFAEASSKILSLIAREDLAWKILGDNPRETLSASRLFPLCSPACTKWYMPLA